MATDPDNILVGASGTVRVAPVGTTVPTDLETAYAAGWVDLGFIGEDGVELTPSVDMNEIMAWQDFYPVRRVVTSRGLDIGIPLLEWNKTTVPLALGGGEITTATGVHKYEPPEPADLDERALAVEWSDGDRNYRWHFARVMVTDLAGFTVRRGEGAILPLTASVMGVTGAKPWHFLTDDPAFAA